MSEMGHFRSIKGDVGFPRFLEPSETPPIRLHSTTIHTSPPLRYVFHIYSALLTSDHVFTELIRILPSL